MLNIKIVPPTNCCSPGEISFLSLDEEWWWFHWILTQMRRPPEGKEISDTALYSIGSGCKWVWDETSLFSWILCLTNEQGILLVSTSFCCISGSDFTAYVLLHCPGMELFEEALQKWEQALTVRQRNNTSTPVSWDNKKHEEAMSEELPEVCTNLSSTVSSEWTLWRARLDGRRGGHQ